jgi:glycosyltransferase involved in cell wall biosynthesis
VGPDDVADLLARSAIFCLPSHFEGFPLAVLEAMASEAAVVATGVGDVPRILDGGRAGVLVPVGDGRRLSEALGSLARSPEERGALAAAGRARVASRWDEDRMVRRLLELYRRVAGDGA